MDVRVEGMHNDEVDGQRARQRFEMFRPTNPGVCRRKKTLLLRAC